MDFVEEVRTCFHFDKLHRCVHKASARSFRRSSSGRSTSLLGSQPRPRTKSSISERSNLPRGTSRVRVSSVMRVPAARFEGRWPPQSNPSHANDAVVRKRCLRREFAVRR